jgi:hypothetical protein
MAIEVRPATVFDDVETMLGPRRPIRTATDPAPQSMSYVHWMLGLALFRSVLLSRGCDEKAGTGEIRD